MYLAVIAQIILVLLQSLTLTAAAKGGNTTVKLNPSRGVAVENITTSSPESGNVSEEATTKRPIQKSTATAFSTTIVPKSALKSGVVSETCKRKKKNLYVKLNLDECQIEESSSPTKVKRRRNISVSPETRTAIIKMFSGILLTEEAFSQQERRRLLKKKHKRPGKRSTETNHNGDMCCPSISIPERVPDNVTNIFGQARDIVSFPDDGVFQFVFKGACAYPNQQCNGGICVPESTTVYLLVWKETIEEDDTMPWLFEPFDIPSFCSCKNVVL